MEALYLQLGHWEPASREALWRRWLWEADCNALPEERCYDFNEMHALGILCCLGETSDPAFQLAAASYCLDPDKPVAAYTLRETLDQLESFQLNWGPTLDDLGEADALRALRALMARLGELAHHAYDDEKEGSPLDDPQHITQLPPEPNEDRRLSVISRKSLRQAICVLCALLRVHWIVSRARSLGADEDDDREVVHSLRVHHIEASMDSFNDLQQLMRLAPGMRLVYRTNFAGMYNHVSQVVYFHFPRFCRQPQLEKLDLIARSAMHMLPLIQQLLPDIPTFYDDDTRIPGITPLSDAFSPSPLPPFVWLVCCGAVFLVDVAACEILTANTLGALVVYFLRKTGRSVQAEEEGGAHHTSIISHHRSAESPYGHLRLI